MRYLLLIYAVERPEVEWSPEEIQAEMDAYGKFTAEVMQSGTMQSGEALQGSETATTVRVRDGETLTTDGPFAETKEVLGGYYLVECKDLDEAIAVAARIPSSKHGSIEVRPVMEFDAEQMQQYQESATQ